MTPDEAIASLDAQLTLHGQSVTLRRYTGTLTPPRAHTDVAATCFVRSLKSDELVGTIDQTWSRVVVSPTGNGSLLPLVKGDKIVVASKERNVEFPQPVYIQSTLVRMDVLVSG